MKPAAEQYAQLMEQCDLNLDRLERELPRARSSLTEALSCRGITRREFMGWASAATADLLLPPLFASRVARAAETLSRLPVIWLQAAECTGCTEAVLQTDNPGIDQILLETISLEYHETLMAPSGSRAEQTLAEAVSRYQGGFICIVEGALPTGSGENYFTNGAQGLSGIEFIGNVAAQAAAVICLGSCASFGNVPAAGSNPTGAKGIGEALGIATVNIPGCPRNQRLG